MPAGFLQKLQTYDKDNIPPEVIAKIRPYMDNPDFEPEVVKKASKAAFGLVSWVRAMEAYDRYAGLRSLLLQVLMLMLRNLMPVQSHLKVTAGLLHAGISQVCYRQIQDSSSAK